MVKKTVGYVELEWTCSQCGTRNPGTRKACSSCGKPQPKGVQFHQAAEEKLISDRDEIARARTGPDVHCAFCGARNPVTAAKCTQCGADLGSASARDSGRVLGAHRAGPAGQVKCSQCGASNPATALKCARCNAALPRAARAMQSPMAAAQKPRRKMGLFGGLGIGCGAIVGLALCVLIVLSLIPAQKVVGTVQSVYWERSVEIEALQDVTKEDWKDEIPLDADLGTCTQKHRRTQDEPAPRATEVCGTPYTVDKGTGHGEVVQDCEYQVYDDWCKYTVREWSKADTAVLSGSDYSPRWPNPNLRRDEREGEREEKFEVVFDTEKETYTYTTSDEARFRQCQVGSRWTLQINALGKVKSIEPAR